MMNLALILITFLAFTFYVRAEEQTVSDPSLNEMMDEKRRVISAEQAKADSEANVREMVEKASGELSPADPEETIIPEKTDYEPLRGSANLRKQEKPPFRPKRK